MENQLGSPDTVMPSFQSSASHIEDVSVLQFNLPGFLKLDLKVSENPSHHVDYGFLPSVDTDRSIDATECPIIKSLLREDPLIKSRKDRISHTNSLLTKIFHPEKSISGSVLTELPFPLCGLNDILSDSGPTSAAGNSSACASARIIDDEHKASSADHSDYLESVLKSEDTSRKKIIFCGNERLQKISFEKKPAGSTLGKKAAGSAKANVHFGGVTDCDDYSRETTFKTNPAMGRASNTGVLKVLTCKSILNNLTMKDEQFKLESGCSLSNDNAVQDNEKECFEDNDRYEMHWQDGVLRSAQNDSDDGYAEDDESEDDQDSLSAFIGSNDATNSDEKVENEIDQVDTADFCSGVLDEDMEKKIRLQTLFEERRAAIRDLVADPQDFDPTFPSSYDGDTAYVYASSMSELSKLRKKQTTSFFSSFESNKTPAMRAAARNNREFARSKAMDRQAGRKNDGVIKSLISDNKDQLEEKGHKMIGFEPGEAISYHRNVDFESGASTPKHKKSIRHLEPMIKGSKASGSKKFSEYELVRRLRECEIDDEEDEENNKDNENETNSDDSSCLERETVSNQGRKLELPMNVKKQWKHSFGSSRDCSDRARVSSPTSDDNGASENEHLDTLGLSGKPQPIQHPLEAQKIHAHRQHAKLKLKKALKEHREKQDLQRKAHNADQQAYDGVLCTDEKDARVA